MPKLVVVLSIPPRQKERPRATTMPIGPKCGRCGVHKVRPKMYTPKATEAWESDVAALIRQASREIGFHGQRFNGPLRVTVDFVKDRPASRPKPSNAEQKGGGHFLVTAEAWATGSRIPAPTRPDLDNYEKSLLDALSKADIWWDDSQVCDIRSRKWYAAKGEIAQIRVKVECM